MAFDCGVAFRRRVWRFGGVCSTETPPAGSLAPQGFEACVACVAFWLGVYPPPFGGGGQYGVSSSCFLFSPPRLKTNASNATHASNPYRIRVLRVAFCLPKRHTCHPNATQTPHACRVNRQSPLAHRVGSSLPVFTAVTVVAV